jgi:hypothetical protein
MALTLILNPFKDPSEDGDWDNQKKKIISRLKSRLSDYPSPVKYELVTGVEGCGADFPIVILRIIEIGAFAFFAIPEFRKRVSEAIQGWKSISKDLSKFLRWLKEEEQISRYSIEVAFYSSLELLSARTNVEELQLIEAREIFGHSGFEQKSFENTEISLYFFIFRENDEFIHVLCLDERLEVHINKSIVIDPFTRFSMES